MVIGRENVDVFGGYKKVEEVYGEDFGDGKNCDFDGGK